MIVDFGHNGYNIAYFSALMKDGSTARDLGIAFVALPHHVWPCVTVASDLCENGFKLEMNYAAGPKGTAAYINHRLTVFNEVVFCFEQNSLRNSSLQHVQYCDSSMLIFVT